MYPSDNIDCCGIQELVDIQEEDSPEEAMLSFCNQVITKNRYTGKIVANMGNIYIFSGVERVTSNKIKTYKNGDGEPEHDIWSNDDYPVKIKYASELARYITRNKLGVLRASPPRSNVLKHPFHILRCWIWCPDEKAVISWFERNNR